MIQLRTLLITKLKSSNKSNKMARKTKMKKWKNLNSRKTFTASRSSSSFMRLRQLFKETCSSNVWSLLCSRFLWFTWFLRNLEVCLRFILVIQLWTFLGLFVDISCITTSFQKWDVLLDFWTTSRTTVGTSGSPVTLHLLSSPWWNSLQVSWPN